MPTPQSWYLDLNMIARYVTGEGARAYHHTAPITHGLRAARRPRLPARRGPRADAGSATPTCGRALQDGLERLGLELFAAEGHRLPELTTVWVPEQHRADEAQLRRLLLDRYGIEIGGGLGAYAGKVWRIGCMGHTARPRNVALLLAALGELLAATGRLPA